MFNKAALSSYKFPCANVLTLLQVSVLPPEPTPKPRTYNLEPEPEPEPEPGPEPEPESLIEHGNRGLNSNRR